MVTPGIVLGGLDLNTTEVDTGVLWAAEPIRGWQGPASSIAVARKPRAHGGWAGSAFMLPRHMTITGKVLAPSEEALTDALDRLNEAATLADTTLTVTEAAGARSCTVRREDEVLAPLITPLLAEFSVQLVAPDPRKFGAPLSGSTALPSSTGGLTVPFTVPFSIDAVTVSGQVSLTNPGNMTGPVSLRIDGPVTGPVVTHVGTGRALVFASSLVLGAGEFVTVDMERQEVLAQGQSSRAGWVTSDGWSGFQPGVNVWSFSALAYDAASLLTVTATPTWE